MDSNLQPDGWDALDTLGTAGSDGLAQAFRRCFNTADGMAVLEHLQALVSGCVAAGAPDSVLRDMEGRRRMVRTIERMIARGAME